MVKGSARLLSMPLRNESEGASPRMAHRRGSLTVITGPMFAGKSAALIARAGRRPGETLALIPAFDGRSDGTLRSREGTSLPARPVSSWPTRAAAQAALLLDEAQFMTAPHYRGDVVADVLGAVRQGAAVAVGGLDTDYRRQPFEVVARLLAAADERVVLRARCHVCGAPAAWTAKKRDTGRLLEVGDAALYEARCDAHWSLPPGDATPTGGG